ncbi:6,7-dimethyl-8-ribityllumazine synthase [Acidisarcina polymorpha]|uniref:6,7-dimethyl-8-ribityllumazine synthase n=1 Tax=Acidisarcina polymorpha TaxID=2211140 RepID=A0A2Z5G8R5_9BACT|nr:6,7-dimethyl-8-ribityllumazine synthase [Acidisarcina polymorpha]AXC15358.1 6,7-dimethyl-8-ribityllumazine synthase [Acidisarcina polymorpha]
MIKGITLVRPAVTSEAIDELTSFFSALGFEPGRGWQLDGSRGVPFLAPLGNVEFVEGQLPATPEILIEVTGLESIYQVAKGWLADRTNEPKLTEIIETSWKSRSFNVEPVPGHSFAFWEWSEPLRGKPIAIEGDLSAAGMSFAIVVARWNAVITDRLLEGSLDALHRSGAAKSDIEIVRVPGAWEVPSAARALAESGEYDAIITLACLIRGETAHYEAIYNEVSRGIGQSQQETGVPHAFGVLTCETLEQALNRAGIKAGNKGFESAIAAIEMVSIHRKLKPSEAAK